VSGAAVSEPVQRVAVVGAGATGLCAARHLLQRGMDVTVFEMGSSVGGLWVYDNDNGRSPTYKSLHINSEAAVTAYEDFPFPDGTPLFPSHELVRSYLEAYARTFGVAERIRFNSTVAAVEPAGRDRWRVVLADGSAEVFDAVVAAPGHQATPSHPPFATASPATTCTCTTTGCRRCSSASACWWWAWATARWMRPPIWPEWPRPSPSWRGRRS
jgi:cation diffusion facilitator CzcD-associated flavoprotein CzcO